MNPLNLIMLPFAGGNKYSYRPFQKEKPSEIDFITPELPGRYSRSKEPLLTDLHAVADDLLEQLKTQINKPYAIYGHSMGALLGILLTRKIIVENLNPPLCLFCSGRGGPSWQYNSPGTYKLPREQFIERVKSFGGVPDSILRNAKLLTLFEPVLRADFEAVECYSHRNTAPLNISITVILGSQDKVTKQQGMSWQNETTIPVDLHEFEGNHFFIFQHASALMNIVLDKLKRPHADKGKILFGSYLK